MADLKVVLDTNVILSGLAYPSSVCGKIMQAWRAGAVDVYLSEYLLDELRRVLPRLSRRHGLNARQIDDLVDILSSQAEVVLPVDVVNDDLRDRHDLPVLGTFVAARDLHDADYLISGDKDLQVLSEEFSIISPAEFWKRHG